VDDGGTFQAGPRWMCGGTKWMGGGTLGSCY